MIIIQSKIQNLLVFNKLFDRMGSVEQFQYAFDYSQTSVLEREQEVTKSTLDGIASAGKGMTVYAEMLCQERI